MKIIYCIVIMLSLISCEMGQRLDMQEMGQGPGYFLECYCKPGDMYCLTATRIAPISEDQLLDYSLEFDVWVVAEEPVKLYHSLFNRPESKLVYNYGSSKVFKAGLVDTLYLRVTAQNGEKITGKTTIPDQIKLKDVILLNNKLSANFDCSSDPRQNYYIFSARFSTDGKKKSREYRYLDYSHVREEKQMHQSFVNDDFLRCDSIEVSLKRLTRENYLYQLTLLEANNANNDNLIIPSPLQSNLNGAIGIFTCYTEDQVTLKVRK